MWSRPPRELVLAAGAPIDETGIDKREAPVKGKGHPETFATGPRGRGRCCY